MYLCMYIWYVVCSMYVYMVWYVVCMYGFICVRYELQKEHIQALYMYVCYFILYVCIYGMVWYGMQYVCMYVERAEPNHKMKV